MRRSEAEGGRKSIVNETEKGCRCEGVRGREERWGKGKGKRVGADRHTDGQTDGYKPLCSTLQDMSKRMKPKEGK